MQSLLFSCKFCKATFSKRNSLYVHTYRKHRAEKLRMPMPRPKYVAQRCACGKFYHNASSLRSHKSRKHKGGGDKRVCRVCERRFSKAYNRSKHECTCLSISQHRTHAERELVLGVAERSGAVEEKRRARNMTLKDIIAAQEGLRLRSGTTLGTDGGLAACGKVRDQC